MHTQIVTQKVQRFTYGENFDFCSIANVYILHHLTLDNETYLIKVISSWTKLGNTFFIEAKVNARPVCDLNL